ncbi:helix-turn-helix transcriptional regulator [Enterococcus sp. ZQ21]|nr:helix-turn-helix transcriptional regulator [Enterococcus sp. ZQ21]WHP04240.1 helix-turn-helix transcriptional regulator [Enterococcus sp. ZQ21]
MIYNILSVNLEVLYDYGRMIKELCEQMNISVSELARRIGQTPQNFNKKLQRETVTLDELKAIADVLGVKFVQAFILPDGNEIKIGN